MIHVSRHDCREWWKKTEMQGRAFQLASQGQFKSLLSFPLSQSVATAWLKIKSTTIFNFSPCHFSISNSRSTQLTKQAWIHRPSAVTIANKDKTEQRNAKMKDWKLSCMETREKSWLVKCLEIVWCRGGDRCVCVCVSSLLIPLFQTLSFIFPSSGRHRLNLTDRTHCQRKNRMGHCWWRHTGDCWVVMEWWPVCMWFCKCSGSCASQRATVTPTSASLLPIYH